MIVEKSRIAFGAVAVAVAFVLTDDASDDDESRCRLLSKGCLAVVDEVVVDVNNKMLLCWCLR